MRAPRLSSDSMTVIHRGLCLTGSSTQPQVGPPACRFPSPAPGLVQGSPGIRGVDAESGRMGGSCCFVLRFPELGRTNGACCRHWMTLHLLRIESAPWMDSQTDGQTARRGTNCWLFPFQRAVTRGMACPRIQGSLCALAKDALPSRGVCPCCPTSVGFLPMERRMGRTRRAT